ncbi:MAG: NAD(P)-dependent oxidoreductase [Acidimicrobiia bacterium]|nr:NAD(P)-dependent oxidoreductase [Acidimicrobiia bacterium]
MRVGFVGLGSQGGGMAERLIDQGVPTTLWARRAESVEPFAGRCAVAADLVELGRASDVVGICVTDGAAVREVVSGVLAGMARGSVLAVHSTIGAAECAEIASSAQATGVRVIDAPVSGGGAMAAAGRLTVYVGGADDVVGYARPMLETYGDPVLHMGPLGSGLRTKLVNNALNASHFALAHDAMALGVALGLDPVLLGDALRNGSGRSYALELFVALGSLAPIAEHAGPIMAKDIGLFAQETGSDAELLLCAADRFLALLGHPRSPGHEP